MDNYTLNTTAGDDSDNDVVTDFLNSNCTAVNVAEHSGSNDLLPKIINSNSDSLLKNSLPTRSIRIESQNYCIPLINTPQQPPPPATASNNNNSNINNINNNNISNMIPTINVTPHSPASVNKYNNIFEDTLSQLQNIRETVVQMKNSSAPMHDGLTNYGLLNATLLRASLPDLTAGNNGNGNLAVVSSGSRLLCGLLNTDRRKSWTAIDDLTAGDCTNKSVSLSSLDSEETEAIRVSDQRRRSGRNSTGGISTHSLNEAELARDIERIAAKRSLASELINRIPLQKSISTSSIVAKEEIKAIARHLTDSEDENQSLLRAHAKIEVYDNVEKRRKRGSLFFRKKKDKSKMKIAGQSSTCDSCSSTITLATVKDHNTECKGRKSSSQKAFVSGSKRNGDKGESGQDYYDGADQGGIFNDDTPLIRSEFLNDPPIEAHDLGADPSLGIALEEHDSWSPSVPKDVLKSLKEKQVKRQEHIYEFIMTEKHHCQTLLVMQKVFVESLERHFQTLNINAMFPRLGELTELHTGFLKKLRQKQREKYVVDSIADILLDFFSMDKAQHLRLAYGEFCANHRTALEHFKSCMTNRDQTFAEWYKHCLANPLLKKKGIPECILFVTQRLTKYPLLIEPLLKSAREDKLEADKLQHALNLVKSLLVDVDACVAEKELRERQIDIFNRIDTKSFAIYKNKPFRKTDVSVESRRRLKFEGLATLMQGRSKMQLVLVVVLTDCLCFLSENSAHNKYMFFTPEHKAGVVPLQKLLIREKAGTESRGIYIISSNPDFPEMYELKVQQPKDKNVWIQSIRQAVLECPSTDVIETEDLTAEEKLRIGVNKRELIEKMRQKDIEQALLLEEKIILQMNLLKDQKNFIESTTSTTTTSSTISATNIGAGAGAGNAPINTVSASNFLASFGSYKDLVNVDCDTNELWKRVQNTVQDISQLASSVYTAATGLPVSRSVSSVGEKQSESYASPTLPKRAETFAGFDEKRSKNIFPSRDISKLSNLQVFTPRLQELEEKRETKCSPSTTIQQHENLTSEQIQLKEHNYAALQISHHLHTLLCIISQQMTTIHNLQLQIALYRESPRAVYTHNDQLEELRNLQDKLQEEKTVWLRDKIQQEQELEERRTQQVKLQEQIKAEQEDIKQQREQLYRKMEMLSNQGLLLSPNTPLLISSPTLPTLNTTDDSHDALENQMQTSSLLDTTATTTTPNLISSSGNVTISGDRRKDKWRTASTISKTPPVNLLSATNAPKINQTSVKQKIPIKLSSLSSTTTTSGSGSGSGSGGHSSKIDKSASFNSSSITHSNSTISSNSVGLTQIFPLKLADKRSSVTAITQQQLTPQHSRTGSSPAIIQHPTAAGTAMSNSPNSSMATSPPSISVHRADSSSAFTFGRHASTPNTSKNLTTKQISGTGASKANVKTEEEEIYF